MILASKKEKTQYYIQYHLSQKTVYYSKSDLFSDECFDGRVDQKVRMTEEDDIKQEDEARSSPT